MRSSFTGLYIGLSGLRAQQTAIDITGHNIANANTPGYSRQRAIMKASNPFTAPAFNRPLSAGQMGNGVEVDAVERMKDSFVEMQIRSEQQTTGLWTQMEDGLEKLQMIFNEPSDTGIRNAMDQLWQSMQTLSQTPEDLSARAVVRENAELLVESFHHTTEQTDKYRMELNEAVKIKVDRVNYLGQQISDLNQRIIGISVSGDSPNDLLDQRDNLINELSELVNIRILEDQRGSVTISINGSSLVENTNFHALEAVPNPDAGGLVDIRWQELGSVSPQITNGSIKALLSLRDEVVPQYQEKLDTFVGVFASSFNEVHAQGYGLPSYTQDFNDTAAGVEPGQGIPFFDIGNGSSGFSGAARTIAVSSQIKESLDAIAAALEPTVLSANSADPLSPEAGPGDSRNLLRMLEIRHDSSIELNGRTGTLTDHFSSIVAELGVDTQRANRIVENQEVLMEHLQNRKEAVAGVSLDEEVANLVQFQHAYSAAARVISTVDEALDVVINRMGLVGR